MRTENLNMVNLLKQHGIKASVKYIWKGSMCGCWRIYGSGQVITKELFEKLNRLGFLNFDCEPLEEFYIGKDFQVFLRGHYELTDGLFSFPETWIE